VRISSIWSKVNPVISAINASSAPLIIAFLAISTFLSCLTLSSASIFKESIYSCYSGLEEYNLVLSTFSGEVILGLFHNLHNNKTVQFL
jgi:hypothetical protein